MSQNDGYVSVYDHDLLIDSRFLRRTFLAGVLAILTAIALEGIASYFIPHSRRREIALAALLAPIVEESVKAFFSVELSKIHPASGFFVGLYFGIIESLLYAASFGIGLIGSLYLFSIRLLVSVPLHAATTSMFLYGLFIQENKKEGSPLFRIFSAYLIHALFNFSLTAVG